MNSHTYKSVLTKFAHLFKDAFTVHLSHKTTSSLTILAFQFAVIGLLLGEVLFD